MDHLIITQIIESLERGRDSVHHIRDLLNQHPGFTADHDDQGYHKGLDDHSMVALTALDYALSMLHHPDNFSLEENQFGNSKSHDSAAETPRKDRRGCYKRRYITVIIIIIIIIIILVIIGKYAQTRCFSHILLDITSE